MNLNAPTLTDEVETLPAGLDVDLGVSLRAERRNPLRLIVEMCQQPLTPRMHERILHIAQTALDAIPLEGEDERG